MLSKWLFRLVCLCVVIAALAVFLMRITGAENMQFFAAARYSLMLAALLAIVSALTALVYLVRKKPVSNRLLYALLIGLSPVALVAVLISDGVDAPMIHDISTDLDNPPVFAFAPQDRQPTSNSLALDEKVISIQRANYSEIRPLRLDVSVEQAIEKVEAVVADLGWQVLGRSSGPYQIEVVDRTALMGFKDDVAIRVTGGAGGAVIDVRSASRVGRSDLGANALRIAELLALLEGCC